MVCVIGCAGCIQQAGPFETVEDFQKEFSSKKTFPPLAKGETLTLQCAVETALRNNPTNLAAAQAVTAAGYGYYRALSAYAPELNVVHSLGHTLTRGWKLKNPPVGVMKKNDHLVTSGTIQASWLLFDGFARELEAVIARQEYNKSAAISKNVRRLLVRAVAYAYYDMYQASEEMIIYREDLDFQNTALQQEQERFRNGHVSKAAILNFKILAARAQSSISNARYRKRTAFHALSALMGCTPGQLPEELVLQKITAAPLPHISDDTFYLELAVLHRPDLQAEKITLEIARRQKQKALSAFFPEIRLFSEFTLDTFDARYGGYRVSRARSRQGGFAYGVEGRWNIFRGFDTVNDYRRRAVLEKVALWGLNAKFLDVAAEIGDACANCRNARYQVKVFQAMAEWVREQRDLVFSAYCNGRETLPRLNEAQATLVEARSRLVVSAVEFHKAVAQLAAAAGLPSDAIVPFRKK
jgi:outer membrane protein TolC